jgi:hypothetical protein
MNKEEFCKKLADSIEKSPGMHAIDWSRLLAFLTQILPIIISFFQPTSASGK